MAIDVALRWCCCAFLFRFQRQVYRRAGFCGRGKWVDAAALDQGPRKHVHRGESTHVSHVSQWTRATCLFVKSASTRGSLPLISLVFSCFLAVPFSGCMVFGISAVSCIFRRLFLCSCASHLYIGRLTMASPFAPRTERATLRASWPARLCSLSAIARKLAVERPTRGRTFLHLG